MAPEQAKGQAVDKRADVWAFGVVLFEMLTGAGAFRGDSIADTMASVLKLEPDFDKLPPETPAAVRRLLRRCLQKEPDRRLHDVADARIEIEEVDLDDPVRTEGEATAAVGPRRIAWLPLLVAVAIGLIAGALLGSVLRPGPAPVDDPGTTRVRRSSIPIPDGRALAYADSVALSPDGSVLVLAAGVDVPTTLFVRRLDSFDAVEVPGTENAFLPFFSPDGDHVAFFADGQLKKVSLRGGAGEVTALCDAPVAGAGAWDASGWIYFTWGESRLARVREDGGTREELPEAGDVYDVETLPGGHGILVTARSDTDSASIRKDTATLAVFSPEERTLRPVLEGGYNARYLSSGHLVFMRSGGLHAVPFDPVRLEASPPAVSVQPGAWTDSVWGNARYDVSRDGTLAYVPGGDYARTIPTWIDLATGEEEALAIPAGVYNNFDLSPDGTRLAIQTATGAQDQVYVYDSRRRTFTRLTEEGSNTYPVWSHDGREVLFASNRDGEDRLFRKPVDGSAPATRLLTDEQEALMETKRRWPCSVTPDGRYLLIMTWAHPRRGGDIWKVPLDVSGDPEPVLATATNEIIPQISPDGRWIAYLSNRTGEYQIAVRPFPDVEQREWIVSTGEGYDARWSPDGDALLYRRGSMGLLSVPVGRGDLIEPGLARELIETDFHDSSGSSFAVSPDGKRVLVNKPVDVSLRDKTPVRLVTGWSGEVSRALSSD
jgi:serine/threonine-protein kinase